MTETIEPTQTPTEPTQVAHPWRATLRTTMAYLVATVACVAVVVPVVMDGMGEHLPARTMTALGVVAGITGALTATITRVMALPAVNAWLTLAGLGAGPRDETIDR